MTLLRGLLLFVCVVVVTAAGALFLLIDSQPSVRATAGEQLNNADTVKKLLAQIQKSVQERTEQHVITLSEHQFDSIVGFVQRASPQLRGKAVIGEPGATFYASAALPFERVDWYLNVEALLLPDDKLNISYLRIGDITMPGGFAVALGEWIINWWTDSSLGSQARAQISQVTMDEASLAVTLKPMESFLKTLNEVRNGIGVEQDDELKQLTAYYLRYISWQDLALEPQPQPFIDYLRLTMLQAQRRSTPETAVLHNKAAILGLAIFIGHHRIANFVGDVQPDVERALKPASPAVLRERNDLARHFIISAALKVLSEQGVSMAIGEFKELMDRAMDGSGYSFVDLAADMAGIELATVATQPALAREVQEILGIAYDEGIIMPAIEDLPEGLSKPEFEQRYQHVDSPAYLKEVEEIQTRLDNMPLYQLHKN